MAAIQDHFQILVRECSQTIITLQILYSQGAKIMYCTTIIK